jgi:hypothetical protein
MNSSDDIPVSLTDIEWSSLVGSFIARRFLDVSTSVYRDAIADGKTPERAVFDAIRNEAVNEVLALVADQMKIQREIENDPLPASKPVKMIWVTFQKEGVHLYPAAATDPALNTGGWDDVSFLGYPHRHIFHFKVQMEVFHDDRDVEFIQLKRWCERLYADSVLDLNHKSCEMISDDLYAKLTERWPGREIVIDVSEDGENGSTACYPV